MSEASDAVVVVGGGISGLACALALAEGHHVLLLEADERFGGKLATGELGGHPLDLGPDAFLTRRPAAEELCRRLGLGDELVAPSASGAALFAGGALRPFPKRLALGVPTDLTALARSRVVGLPAVARAGLDLVLPGRAAPEGLLESLETGGPDPTVAEVVGRRLGRAVLDRLADPLIGGINAGDARSLSFASAAPSIASLAAGRRSLLRALRGAASSPGAAPTKPIFYGLRGGLAGLAARLAEACVAAGVELRSSTPVERAEALGRGGWRLRGPGGELETSGLVLAVPAYRAASLLGASAPGLAEVLGTIAYASVATVTVAFARDAVPAALARQLAGLVGATEAADDRAHLLPGSGVLVARAPSLLVTAVTFTSTKWPHSVPRELVALRCSVGRHGDERLAGLDDDELVGGVRRDLATICSITARPVEVVLKRWPASFPQYVSGHRASVALARRYATALAPLALCGSAYDGIGIPACIESGEAAAVSLAEALGR